MGSIKEYQKKDGTISYQATVRRKGLPILTSSFHKKSLAKAWIQETEAGIRDGRFLKEQKAKNRTISQMLNRYKEHLKLHHPDRLKKLGAHFEYWIARIGDKTLNEVTPAVLADERDYLLTKPKSIAEGMLSPSTVNRYIATLSTAYTTAIKEWGWLEHSPLERITMPKENKSRTRFLSRDEIDRLMIACKQSECKNLYPIVVIALSTAMRFGEIVELRWENIDFQQKTITIEKTKNGDRRILPLTKQCEKVLLEKMGDIVPLSGLVFPNKHGALSTNSLIRSPWITALDKAGIEDFRFHDLRHTAASYFAMNGATQGELMTILGHKNPRMTVRYAHYSQQHIAELMNRTNNLGVNE